MNLSENNITDYSHDIFNDWDIWIYIYNALSKANSYICLCSMIYVGCDGCISATEVMTKSLYKII